MLVRLTNLRSCWARRSTRT